MLRSAVMVVEVTIPSVTVIPELTSAPTLTAVEPGTKFDPEMITCSPC
jgi:hypothetical protein